MEFLIHTLTWEEVLRLAMRGATIKGHMGSIISSKVAPLVPNAAGFKMYCDFVEAALKDKEVVPFSVRAAHHLRVVEREIGVAGASALKSKMPKPKPFTWSFTALQQHAACAQQYAAERYYGLIKFVENEHSIWGSRVHKALEIRLKHGTPLPDGMKQWEKYCAKFEQVCTTLDAVLYPELQITVSRNFHMIGWFDNDAFGRCALDVCIDAGGTVYIYDWKTGKKKDNELQLKVCAAMAALKFPHAKRFVVKYIWLQEEGHNATSGTEVHVSEIAGIWELITEKIAQAELDWQTEEFRCAPSGLCYGWCSHTACDHWKPKK